VKKAACRKVRQQGFSLPETLIALLLFSISSLALTQYQLALGKAFQLQAQQREAVRLAWQRFEGYEAPGWRTTLEQQTLTGSCTLFTAQAISPAGARARLSQLRCDNAVR